MRVVCVDDSQPKNALLEAPVKGRIYTVTEEVCGIRCAGYKLAELWGIYYVTRFRPLDESRLDQFRVHLNPKWVEEKVNA